MDLPSDSRFPTRNTNLAACLAALRVPIKTTDPVYVVEEGEDVGRDGTPLPSASNGAQRTDRPTVTYFFEEASAPNNDGHAMEQSTHVDWAWRNRDKFEAENPEHPLIHMRRAIDKLEWLIKVKHGQIKPASRNGFTPIATDDIILAACVMASGHELHSLGRAVTPLTAETRSAQGTDRPTGNVVFLLNIPEPEYERIVEEFACFRHGKDPVCYMRKALVARKELIALVKRAPVLLRYQNGEKEGFIPKGISAEKLNRFFEFLYE